MKVAVTGAGGMLGHALVEVLSNIEIIGFTHDNLEFEPEKAYLVNGIGTRNVVMVCEEINCPVIYIGSDYIFDGTKNSPYDEWDRPNPINTYGLSKLMGEKYISSLTNKFFIIRTSWLYGSYGTNFVETIIRLLSQKDSIEVVSDQVGCPTYTIDLAGKIPEIIKKGYGIYHVTNSGSCSWYDFAVAIAEKKGFKKKISPVTSDHFNRPAKRPSYSVLGNTMLRLEGIGLPRKWEEALEEYLAEHE
jgi:dTDP-4-dehydrorhamnose reductase